VASHKLKTSKSLTESRRHLQDDDHDGHDHSEECEFDGTSQAFKTVDADCCTGDAGTDLKSDFYSMAVSAGYDGVTQADTDSVIDCWCGGKWPLAEDGSTFLMFDLMGSMVGEPAPTANAESLSALDAMCQDSTCNSGGIAYRAYSISWFCVFMGLVGATCPASSSEMAAAEQSCECAIAADNGAAFDTSGIDNIDPEDALKVFCPYSECHDYVSYLAGTFNSLPAEIREMGGIGTFNDCSGLSTAVIIGIAVGAGALCCLCVVIAVVVMMMGKKKKGVTPAATQP
jgi:hypothetical protein